jgi:hypothetical protein
MIARSPIRRPKSGKRAWPPALPVVFCTLLAALLIAGCPPGKMDKSTARALLERDIQNRGMIYDFLVGLLDCPRGCEDCFVSKLQHAALADGWITAKCIADKQLEVQATEKGQVIFDQHAKTVQKNGTIRYKIILGRDQLHKVEEPQMSGGSSLPVADVSYYRAFKPTPVALELMKDGPIKLPYNVTLRLCGNPPNVITSKKTCDMAIEYTSTSYYWNSDDDAWKTRGGGGGGGLIGPR